jgi:hypothetical protein
MRTSNENKNKKVDLSLALRKPAIISAFVISTSPEYRQR